MWRKATELSIPKCLLAGSLLAAAMNVVGAQAAMAEPLTPLTPIELQYLDQVHRVFSVSRDNMAFHSDAELLDSGQLACQKRDIGLVGYSATGVSPVITQLAFIYLCPQ
ncbi:hypothetical protein MycrhDRAFT_3685 [Mycolicibacterium rhodesiae JS60]|nr:hypothetical protein MycrhDRAFT_3685 [Mycolicibacterium rhodesiae JS60]